VTRTYFHVPAGLLMLLVCVTYGVVHVIINNPPLQFSRASGWSWSPVAWQY